MSAWQPIATAPQDGTLCALRFRDPLGSYEAPGPYFLHDDGYWYLVEPPTQIVRRPSHWIAHDLHGSPAS